MINAIPSSVSTSVYQQTFFESKGIWDDASLLIQLATVDHSGNCCYVVLLSLDVVHCYSNNDSNY